MKANIALQRDNMTKYIGWWMVVGGAWAAGNGPDMPRKGEKMKTRCNRNGVCSVWL